MVLFSSCEGNKPTENEDGSLAYYKAYSLKEFLEGWKQAYALNEIDMDTVEDQELRQMYLNQMHKISEISVPQILLDHYTLESIYVGLGAISYHYVGYNPTTGERIPRLEIHFGRDKSDEPIDFTYGQATERFIFDGNLTLDTYSNWVYIYNNGFYIEVDVPDNIILDAPKDVYKIFTWENYTLEEFEAKLLET